MNATHENFTAVIHWSEANLDAMGVVYEQEMPIYLANLILEDAEKLLHQQYGNTGGYEKTQVTVSWDYNGERADFSARYDMHDGGSTGLLDFISNYSKMLARTGGWAKNAELMEAHKELENTGFHEALADACNTVKL